LLDATRVATRSGVKALHHHALADARLSDDEIVDVQVVIVLGVCDRRLQNLLDRSGNTLARERKLVQRALRREPADRLRYEIELARTDADHPAYRSGLVVRKNAPERLLAHHSTLFALLSPPAECP